MRQRKIIPGVDPKLLIKDASKLMPDFARRNFLSGAASLGALAFLASFSVLDGMVTEDTAAPGISREYAERAKTAWLESADVKAAIIQLEVPR
jgi:hypothetical protein